MKMRSILFFSIFCQLGISHHAWALARQMRAQLPELPTEKQESFDRIQKKLHEGQRPTAEDRQDLQDAFELAVLMRDKELARQFSVELHKTEQGFAIEFINDHPVWASAIGAAFVVASALISYMQGQKTSVASSEQN